MSKIVWSKDAKNELADIIRYIKQNTGKSTAEKIKTRFFEEIHKIAEYPQIRRISPALSDFGINHIFQLNVKPWIVYYKLEIGIILILSIIDGRRNLEEILHEKIISGNM